MGPKGCQKVVRVHGHVDESVEQAAEGCVAAADKSRSKPNRDRQAAMMDHVERAEDKVVRAESFNFHMDDSQMMVAEVQAFKEARAAGQGKGQDFISGYF